MSNAINDEDDPEMHSDLDDSYAKIVYRRVEGTSATRPTMIVDPAEARRGRVETVMFRDGSRPHLPFNLVFDRDEFGPIAR